jgi:hypothetical protein
VALYHAATVCGVTLGSSCRLWKGSGQLQPALRKRPLLTTSTTCSCQQMQLPAALPCTATCLVERPPVATTPGDTTTRLTTLTTCTAAAGLLLAGALARWGEGPRADAGGPVCGRRQLCEAQQESDTPLVGRATEAYTSIYGLGPPGSKLLWKKHPTAIAKGIDRRDQKHPHTIPTGLQPLPVGAPTPSPPCCCSPCKAAAGSTPPLCWWVCTHTRLLPAATARLRAYHAVRAGLCPPHVMNGACMHVCKGGGKPEGPPCRKKTETKHLSALYNACLCYGKAAAAAAAALCTSSPAINKTEPGTHRGCTQKSPQVTAPLCW